ncbi:uncharacterized protein ARMOST_12663 [Armillaria ostoyae]|uniref:Uncharacterized protein n=1 Tax=Armillaria ostoyae TaxID=47428 RepID=A0A284RKJ9_ARMOS|nr:uncharacterized protein ARMOST_12663 [Armillaria ostoyae]
MTPSTPTAPTTSGQSSPPSIDRSSASIAPRPGNYKDAMSRCATSSTKMTGPPWTGTSPSIVATQLSAQGYGPAARVELHGQHRGRTDQEQRDLEIAPTWTESTYNNFNNFNYDEGTFGGYTPKLPWDHKGYTLAPTPLPFPDSPPNCCIRQHSQYHGQKSSRLVAGQGDNEAGGSDLPPTDPSQPSHEKHLLQAKELLALKE